jgi:acetyltransferase EpsM
VSDRPQLLVLGTTLFATEIADVATDAGFEVTGYVENLDRERCASDLDGRPVHWIDDCGSFAATHVAVCGLGTTKRSVFTDQAAAMGLRFATIVHPTAHVSQASVVGEGAIVGVNVVVAAHAEIGRHVLLNRGSMVGHHTQIGDYVSVLPGANIAGSCVVGRAAYIGMGSIVIDHLSVGDESVVAAGAVVVEDVPANVLVVGIPAKVVKQGVSRR